MRTANAFNTCGPPTLLIQAAPPRCTFGCQSIAVPKTAVRPLDIDLDMIFIIQELFRPGSLGQGVFRFFGFCGPCGCPGLPRDAPRMLQGCPKRDVKIQCPKHCSQDIPGNQPKSSPGASPAQRKPWEGPGIGRRVWRSCGRAPGELRELLDT